MKSQFDCIPCIIRQTIEAARISTDKEDLQRQVINKAMQYLQEADFDVSPPQLGRQIVNILRDITGCEDPYKEIKLKMNTIALQHYSQLKRMVYLNDDPVDLAAKLAVSGNLLNSRSGTEVSQLENILADAEKLIFTVNDFNIFLDHYKSVRKILYLADNAGEIVFDKLFIEVLQRFYPEIKHEFTVVVRGAPILNDATLEDARLIDLDKIAMVIDNGDRAPATVLKYVSKEMKAYYEEADIVISKGQGNYESLHDEKKPIYFLFRVRCPIISAEVKVPDGSLIFKKSNI